MEPKAFSYHHHIQNQPGLIPTPEQHYNSQYFPTNSGVRGSYVAVNQEPQQHSPRPQKQKRHHTLPFGLSPIAFGALIALITALVVGGAVGGGLAGACKSFSSSGSCDTTTAPSNSSPAPTTTLPNPSSTADPPEQSSIGNYAVFAPEYIANLTNPCASLSSPVNGGGSDFYTVTCNTDLSNGAVRDDYILADISGLGAYSIQDCLRACGNHNWFLDIWQIDTPRCVSVTWAQTFYNGYIGRWQNCWLKNGTWSGTYKEGLVSATLVGSGQ